MSAVDLFIHQGHDLRVVTVGGEPWFVAADVARILSYRMASDMTRVVDEDEKGTQIVRTPGGDQRMAVINEAGLYSVILQRQAGYVASAEGRAAVKGFQRWVTHEVLPQIRRTGRYQAEEPSRKQLALMVIAAEDARESAELARMEAEEKNRELLPAAAAWERLASASGDFSVEKAAKTLSRDPQIEIGQRRLFAVLADLKWIYRDRSYGMRGTWTAYQAAIDCHRLAHRACSHEHPHTGALVLDPPQVRVTPKGLGELHRHLGGVDLPAVLVDVLPGL